LGEPINIYSILFYSILVLAAPSDKIDMILKIFNDYHDRLKFTIEHENNRSLSFLLIRISNNTIYINWFHKKTLSERFLFEIGIIYSLIDRAFLLSNLKFHQKNLEFAIELLLNNGYLFELIFEKINDRIKTLINNKRNPIRRISADNNNDSINGKKFIVLPYIN